MNGPLEGGQLIVVRIVQTICLAVVIVVTIVATCQVRKPPDPPEPPEIPKKSHSQECTDLCAPRRVDRFIDSTPYFCECERTIISR